MTAPGDVKYGALDDSSDPELRRRYGSLVPAAPGARVRYLVVLAGRAPAEPVWIPEDDAPSTRLVVVAEAGSRATIVETLGGKGERAHAVEMFLEDGARIEFVSVQAADPDARVSLAQRASVGTNASVRWKNATLGAREVRHDLRSELEGADARSAVDWLFYARGVESQALSARNVFGGARGGGEIVMKGVAEEKAHVRCDGMIEIGRNGTGTDTYLTQEVLMLDPAARVDAVPGLEIKTNDVKASHSATVTRVTEEDLFYFAARGIRSVEARRMFVEGFLGDLLEGVGDARARHDISALVEAKYALAR